MSQTGIPPTLSHLEGGREGRGGEGGREGRGGVSPVVILLFFFFFF